MSAQRCGRPLRRLRAGAASLGALAVSAAIAQHAVARARCFVVGPGSWPALAAASARALVGARAGSALAQLPEEVDDDTLKKLLPPIELEKYGGPKEQTLRNKEANGMAYEFLSKGKAGGAIPGPDSDVEIIFTGWRVKDGELIDSSFLRGGQPEKFNLNDVMTGWKIGIKQMKEGERRRLWIPSALGDGKGDMVYEMELVKTGDGPPWGFFIFVLVVTAAVQVFLRQNAEEIAKIKDPLADPAVRAALAPEGY